MQSQKFLLDLFDFNDTTNIKLLKKINQLTDQTECIRLFSHLINCQYKWMARIQQNPAANTLSWWDPIYPQDQLASEWKKSLQIWKDYLNNMTEESLHTEVTYNGSDKKLWAATPFDMAMQLNLHSVHHRAQMQAIIRSQGLEPDFVDYIGTRYRRLG